jgi:hypothetical protein
MPRGTGRWRRRENSGRSVGGRLPENGRGQSPAAEAPDAVVYFRESDSRGTLGPTLWGHSTISPLSVKWADAGKHYGVTEDLSRGAPSTSQCAVFRPKSGRPPHTGLPMVGLPRGYSAYDPVGTIRRGLARPPHRVAKIESKNK